LLSDPEDKQKIEAFVRILAVDAAAWLLPDEGSQSPVRTAEWE
jgi:hypothetical protein